MASGFVLHLLAALACSVAAVDIASKSVVRMESSVDSAGEVHQFSPSSMSDRKGGLIELEVEANGQVHSFHPAHESDSLEEHSANSQVLSNTPITTRSPTDWVTCGGHKAPSCSACPFTDSIGMVVTDHGSDWCHGECRYFAGSCQRKGDVAKGSNAPVVQSDAPASAPVRSQSGESHTSGTHSTTPIPDILNQTITAYDKQIIEQAADNAIREENLEAAERLRAQKKEQESKKWTWSKFWQVAIVTFSAIMGVCAVVSIAMFFGVALFGQKGKNVDDYDEDEGLADAAAMAQQWEDDPAAAAQWEGAGADQQWEGAGAPPVPQVAQGMAAVEDEGAWAAEPAQWEGAGEQWEGAGNDASAAGTAPKSEECW